ncbi:aminopeptidase N [Ixodes scapularis]
MAVNDDLEMLKIDVETPLEFNETYSLSLEFAGSINKSPRGLYKSFSNYGERITVTGTHFQPTYARRAFPCFDEPALRATFSVVVVRPKNYRSFSNMAISKSEERHEGLPQGYDETICQRMKLRSKDFVADYYERTPPMSTHLLAFVIGPYMTAGSGIIKVHGTSQELQNSEYVLQVAPTIFSYYQESFRINYPFSKLDLVAVPTLPTPAMEHWGLITFQPVFLKFHKEETPFKLKIASLKLVARKIAQQWLGNLVTVAWWDHMWLKEGISEYLAYSAASAADAQADLLSTVLVDEVHNSMEYDGHNTSHPVSMELNTPLQIRKHMNPAVNAKSVSMIRMLSHLLPKDAFRVGLRQFLKKYSYKSVQPEHLFNELHLVRAESSNNLTVIYFTW